MFINISKAILGFSRIFCHELPKWHRHAIPRLMTGILASHGSPNFSVLARNIVMEKRNKSTIMKFFSFERHVDLLLLTFLFTEWFRLKKYKESDEKKNKSKILRVGTRQIIRIWEEQVTNETVMFIKECINRPRSKQARIFHETLALA